MAVLVIFGVVALIAIYYNLYSEGRDYRRQQKRNQKLDDERRKVIEKDSQSRINTMIDNLSQVMCYFAYTNKKITTNLYDIEEGGVYLREYDDFGKKVIDQIVKEELQKQSRFFFEWPGFVSESTKTIHPKTISSIERRIIELPNANTGDKSIGF